MGIRAYFREFFPFLVNCRSLTPTILALFLSTGLQSSAQLMLPMVNKIIYDDLLVTRDRLFLVFVVGYVFAFVLVANLSSFLVDACSGHLRTKLAGLIRQTLFSRMLDYRMGFFQGRETGGMVQNLIADVDAVSQVLAQVFQVSAYLMQLGLLLAVIVSMDRDVATVFAVVLAFYLVWLSLWRKPIESSSKRIGDEYSSLYGFFFEAIPGVKEIKLQGLKDYILGRLARNAGALKRQQMRNTVFNSFLWMAAITVPWVSFCYILHLALGKFDSGEMTMGTLVTMFVLMWGMFSPVDKISTIFNTLSNALPAARRINALRGDHAESPGGGDPGNFRERIEFKNVGFSYDARNPSLDGVDMTIRKGSRVAIVGHSGSGKSTLLNLLLRFHEGYSGSIAIDGRDLQTLEPSKVRALCCVVVQDPFLFNDSIRGNIDFTGRMPIGELTAVCEQARLGAFIRGLPQGLETQVGERATRLSGGEKQRIALARALARRAGILILDEATSALDPETDRQFRDTVRAMWEANGMTLISVTHRAATAMDSDYVYLLEKGKVVEHGSPAELLARDGAFRKMFHPGNDG